MIIIMKHGYKPEELQRVVDRVHEDGYGTHLSIGEDSAIIGVIGVPITEDLKSAIEAMDEVDTVLRVATGELSEEDLAGWFRVRVQPR